MRGALCRIAPFAVAGLLLPGPAGAQDAASYYEERCAVCHTIGGGDQAGPDLKGITARLERQWLLRFLLDPEGVVASGDEYAARIVAQWNGFVMPATEGLTREMAEELLDYIDKQSRQAAEAAPATPAVAFTEDDRARGFDLFTGRSRLANAGPACVACHGLGGAGGTSGGLLGPDLAAVHARLGGGRGTMAWLARPPTTMMRAIYRRASLTEDESRSLAALFESTAATAAAPTSPERRWLLLTGLAGTLASLAAIGLVWRGRFGHVRRRLLEDGHGRSGR